MRDGEVADPIALAEALKTLFAENELPKRVRLGIAHQRIVVRTLDLDVVVDDPKALAAAVKAAAPDHIPMPMDEAVLDFQPLGTVNTPLGLRSRVVVVAVRKEMVERAAAAVEGAGLEIEGIDLSAFGMVRALASEHEGAVLYINVAGPDQRRRRQRRTAACSPARPRAASSRSRPRWPSAAGSRSSTPVQWMSHVGLVAPLDGIEGDMDLVAATRAALEDGVRELADGIRTSLNFYRTQDAAETVELGVVTGPAIAIPGFVEKLSEHAAPAAGGARRRPRRGRRERRPPDRRRRPRRRRAPVGRTRHCPHVRHTARADERRCGGRDGRRSSERSSAPS